MPGSVSRLSEASRALILYHVIRYHADTRRALGNAVPVEAETKEDAARKVCGFKVASDAGPRNAVASVIGLGEAPRQRTCFRKQDCFRTPGRGRTPKGTG